MGNELNFDELDKAVSSYMNKSPDPAPTAAPTTPIEPSPNPIPVSASVAKPVASADDQSKLGDLTPVTTSAPTQTPAAPAAPTAHAEPRIQVRPRQSIASRRAASGSTFHDIMPGHRRSAVASGKPVAPLNDLTSATPVPPVKAPLPEESPTADVIASPTTSQPASPAPIESSEIKQAAASEPATGTAKILGSTENLPKPAETGTSTAPGATNDADGLLVHPANREVSDALLEDLRKESEAAAQNNPPADAKPAMTPEPANAPEPAAATLGSEATAGLLSKTPLELEDSKPAEAASATAAPAGGLIDTGEIRQTNTMPVSPVDASHMLDAGEDEQPMQVFDTKQYHTPIAGHNDTAPQGGKNKKLELIIIGVVLTIIIAAALVAYMMFFSAE